MSDVAYPGLSARGPVIVPPANPDHWTRNPQDAWMRKCLLRVVHEEVSRGRGDTSAGWRERFTELVERDCLIRSGESFRA